MSRNMDSGGGGSREVPRELRQELHRLGLSEGHLPGDITSLNGAILEHAKASKSISRESIEALMEIPNSGEEFVTRRAKVAFCASKEKVEINAVLRSTVGKQLSTMSPSDPKALPLLNAKRDILNTEEKLLQEMHLKNAELKSSELDLAKTNNPNLMSDISKMSGTPADRIPPESMRGVVQAMNKERELWNSAQDQDASYPAECMSEMAHYNNDKLNLMKMRTRLATRQTALEMVNQKLEGSESLSRVNSINLDVKKTKLARGIRATEGEIAHQEKVVEQSAENLMKQLKESYPAAMQYMDQECKINGVETDQVLQSMVENGTLGQLDKIDEKCKSVDVLFQDINNQSKSGNVNEEDLLALEKLEMGLDKKLGEVVSRAKDEMSAAAKETGKGVGKETEEAIKRGTAKEVSPKAVAPKEVSPKAVAPKAVAPKEVSPKEVSPKAVGKAEPSSTTNSRGGTNHPAKRKSSELGSRLPLKAMKELRQCVSDIKGVREGGRDSNGSNAQQTQSTKKARSSHMMG